MIINQFMLSSKDTFFTVNGVLGLDLCTAF